MKLDKVKWFRKQYGGNYYHWIIILILWSQGISTVNIQFIVYHKYIWDSVQYSLTFPVFIERTHKIYKYDYFLVVNGGNGKKVTGHGFLK